MEIVVLSNSRISELLRYTTSRYPVKLYLPLALFLCMASVAAGWPRSVTDFAINVFVASTLLFQFRLWDDLSDVAHDRARNTERVLLQAESLLHFRILLAAAFILNLGLLTLFKPVPVIVVFLLLNATFLHWYWILRKVCLWPVVSYHIVLIKYPVFVYLLSSRLANSYALLFAASLVYLCFCVHEVLHDHRFRSVRLSFEFLAFELAALSGLAALTVFELNALGRPSAVQAVLAVSGTAVLVFLWSRHRTRLLPGPWPRAVFLVGFFWLLNYSLLATGATPELDVPHTSDHKRAEGNLS